MSLCRWSETCDVYCYEHPEGRYVLEIASDSGRATLDDLTAVAAVETLKRLRAEGIRFPDAVLDRLAAET